MAACCEAFLCGDKSGAALAIFRSYDYGASASEAVEKTAADGKNYRKCSLCVIACIATVHQQQKKRLVTKARPV